MAEDIQPSAPLESEETPVAKGEAEALNQSAAIEARIEEFDGNLRWKEEMVLACLTEEIHSAYRLNWITDANAFFRRAATLKKRLRSRGS